MSEFNTRGKWVFQCKDCMAMQELRSAPGVQPLCKRMVCLGDTRLVSRPKGTKMPLWR